MNVLIFLVPLALILGAIFIGLFIWSAKSGQYDDLDTPAYRILFDEKESNISEHVNKNKGRIS